MRFHNNRLLAINLCRLTLCGQTVKSLRVLASKFELDQTKRKSKTLRRLASPFGQRLKPFCVAIDTRSLLQNFEAIRLGTSREAVARGSHACRFWDVTADRLTVWLAVRRRWWKSCAEIIRELKPQHMGL